jgi:hypothetical protein
MAERPLLAAAFLCEKVLLEKDEVVSAIRIVDTLFVSIPSNLPTDPKPVIQVTALVCFKKASPGVEAEKHQAGLRLHLPSGKEQPPSTMDFTFKPDEVAGANLIVNMSLPAQEFGKYWLDVAVDGEPMTRIPFRLLEKVETPKPTIH